MPAATFFANYCANGQLIEELPISRRDADTVGLFTYQDGLRDVAEFEIHHGNRVGVDIGHIGQATLAIHHHAMSAFTGFKGLDDFK